MSKLLREQLLGAVVAAVAAAAAVAATTRNSISVMHVGSTDAGQVVNSTKLGN